MIHGQNTYPSLHGNQNLNFFEIRPESCLIGRCRQTNFVPLVFCETIIRQLLVSHKKAQFLRLKTYCNSLSEKDYYEVYASHQKKTEFCHVPFSLVTYSMPLYCMPRPGVTDSAKGPRLPAGPGNHDQDTSSSGNWTLQALQIWALNQKTLFFYHKDSNIQFWEWVVNSNVARQWSSFMPNDIDWG